MVVYGMTDLADRRQAYGLLALAVREHWGLDSLPPMERGNRGKPYFPTLPLRQFSLSHSGALALCALADGAVGADVQVVTPRRSAFLDRVLSPQERAWLGLRGDDPGAFTLLWTMKESLCKFTGQGLTRPISAISVPLPEGEPAQGGVLIQAGLSFTLFSGPGWRAALCAAGDTAGEIRWRTGGELPPVFEIPPQS